MVRALGRMTGRLGEWHVETLAEIVQGEEGRPGSRLTSGFQFAERLLPEFERLLIYTWRRKLDRKSTRLNSSHVAISYAVFCLKKKKQHTIKQHKTEGKNHIT